MKRQRSRNRGGGGGNNGGKPQQHNANRAFDSNGPDSVKIRGNAQHVFEKYQQLARDAQSSGDRVLAENYLQHAEHYFRVLRAVQPQRPASEIIGRDAFTSGIDIDFEDETPIEQIEGDSAESGAEDGGEGRSDQQRQEPRGDNGRQGQDYRGEYRNERRPDYRRDEYRQDRPPEARRDERPDTQRQDTQRSEGRQDQGRYEGRRDEPRRDEPRRDEPRRDEPRRDDRGYNRDDRPAQGQGQQGQGRDRDRDRDRDRGYRDDRPARSDNRPRESVDPLPVVEPEATPLTRAASEDSAHTLRSHDGGFSPAPAFLQARPESAGGEEAEAAPEPRRRRTRTAKPAADTSADES